MQMKQGVLINTVFPPTKRSVNYRTISGTRHLNKYLIKLEQSTCMFDKKNPSQFLFNANGLYSDIKGAFFPVCQQSDRESHERIVVSVTTIQETLQTASAFLTCRFAMVSSKCRCLAVYTM